MIIFDSTNKNKILYIYYYYYTLVINNLLVILAIEIIKFNICEGEKNKNEQTKIKYC